MARQPSRWAGAGAAAAALCFSPATGVHSQDTAEAPTGLRIELGFSSELRLDQNPELDPGESGTALVSDTGLRFAIASETRRETFLFALDTNAILSTDTDLVESEIQEPSLAFSYTREASRSRLALSLNRRVADVDRTLPLLIDLDGDGVPEFISVEDVGGTVAFTNASLRLETGIDRPIGHVLSVALGDRTFQDTPVGSDLFGSRTFDVSSATRLRFSPVTSGVLTASISEYEADDDVNTERETRTISFGIDHVLDSTTEITGEVGYSRIETQDDLGTDTEAGLVASFGAKRVLPRGSIGFEYALTRKETGARQTLTVDRSFEFPASSLDMSLGATKAEDEINLVAEATYRKELKRGDFTASLTRGITESATTDQDELLTRLSLAYRQEINQHSAISFEFEVVGRDSEEGRTDADLTAAYSHTLTADWGLSVGYRARYRDDTDGEAVSNVVFATIDRNFLWRP